MNDQDVTRALQQAGLLADVTISVWGGTKTDPELLNEVKRQHGAHGDVGRVMKNLLAGHDARLKAARGAYAAVRQRHYELTRPWVSDPHAMRQVGPRLLTHPLFDFYMKEIASLRRVAFDKRDEFVDHYPDDAKSAQQNLGSMAQVIEYPSAEEVAAAFRIHFDIEPIPETAQFRGLPDAALQGLRKNLEKKQRHQVESAVASAWAESKERIEHLIERLKTGATGGSAGAQVGDNTAATGGSAGAKVGEDKNNPRFKNSTVEHVRELLTLLPGWNITGNPQVEDIVRDIGRMLDQVSGPSLRRDEGQRATVAAQAQQVVDKMKGWGL